MVLGRAGTILLAFGAVYSKMLFMAKSLTIRDLPDDACAELAAPAARRKQSLQAYLHEHLVALAERPDPTELRDRVQRRKHSAKREISPDVLLGWRDRDRK